ncbi:porin family protein [Aerophototrophica crusticola]|uniref:Porin family protein n=1 Tax=Aerophototrophica crusticola TaxID=1709002 RepID=A0A858R7X9_9PROT|nr:porin family protein [Rhodospirillaceae bacterium B3]
MTTKKILAATAAALAISAAAAVPALAKDGFYVAPSLGLLVPQSQDYDDGVDTGKVEFDNGWTIGAAAGYRFGQFRVEGELAYGEVSGGDFTFNGAKSSFDAEQTLFSGTLAGYYDFGADGIQPYVGGGIGFLSADIENVSALGINAGDLGSDTNLTLFGEAGVAIPVGENLAIVPSYRYIWVDDGGDGFDNNTAHNFRVALRVGF